MYFCWFVFFLIKDQGFVSVFISTDVFFCFGNIYEITEIKFIGDESVWFLISFVKDKTVYHKHNTYK